MDLNFFIFTVSQIWTSPELVPIPSMGPFTLQATEVTVSFNPRSQSLRTLDETALHKQTLDPRPTARQFCSDQSIRLRQKSSWRAGASRTLEGNFAIFLFFWLEACEISLLISKHALGLVMKEGSLTTLDWRYFNVLLFLKESIPESLLSEFKLRTCFLQILEMETALSLQLIFSLFSSISFSQFILRLDAFLMGMNLSFRSSSSCENFLTMLVSSKGNIFLHPRMSNADELLLCEEVWASESSFMKVDWQQRGLFQENLENRMGDGAGLSHEDLLSMFINLNKPLCREFYIILNKIKIDSFNFISLYINKHQIKLNLIIYSYSVYYSNHLSIIHCREGMKHRQKQNLKKAPSKQYSQESFSSGSPGPREEDDMMPVLSHITHNNDEWLGSLAVSGQKSVREPIDDFYSPERSPEENELFQEGMINIPKVENTAKIQELFTELLISQAQTNQANPFATQNLSPQEFVGLLLSSKERLNEFINTLMLLMPQYGKEMTKNAEILILLITKIRECNYQITLTKDNFHLKFKSLAAEQKKNQVKQLEAKLEQKKMQFSQMVNGYQEDIQSLKSVIGDLNRERAEIYSPEPKFTMDDSPYSKKSKRKLGSRQSHF